MTLELLDTPIRQNDLTFAAIAGAASTALGKHAPLQKWPAIIICGIAGFAFKMLAESEDRTINVPLRDGTFAPLSLGVNLPAPHQACVRAGIVAVSCMACCKLGQWKANL